MIKLFTALSIVIPAIVFNFAAAQYQGQSNCMTPDGLAGVCISVKECPPLVNLLQMRPLTAEAIDFLRKSQCEPNGAVTRACCIIQNNRIEPFPTSNQNLLPTECGKDLTQRIVGGERTELDEFPWMVLLEYTRPYKGKSLACGGVLISRRYVLTAAHCIKGKDLPKTWSLQSVRLGEYDINSERDCIQDDENSETCADDPVIVGVEEQIAHEKYQPSARSQMYDIALLRLAYDVPFTNYIKPICLPSSNDIGQQLFVAGWGKTENGSSSNIKLKLKLPLTDKQICQETYNSVGVTLGFGQICAGGERAKDSCRGDSGGPLMSVNFDSYGNGNWTAIGVVSFGPSPCGMQGWPGVYTNVYNFVPWILSKMRP